jgi:hypothetical protein
MNSKNCYYYLTLLFLMFSGILEAQQLKTFSTIPGRTASNKYTSRVRQIGSPTWQDEFVIQTTCKPTVLEDGTTDSGYFGNLNGWSASYIAFEFENTSVQVEITKADGNPITKAVVRPEGDGTVEIVDGKAIVTLTKNVNVNVDIDGQMEDNYTGDGYQGPTVHTFCIFANPIYTPPTAGKVITLQPDQDIRSLNRDDWDAIIFAPGVHNVGKEFEIMSNETLYFPGDAIVHGTIHPNKDNSARSWTIYGSGALSSENINWSGDGITANKSFTNGASGFRVEGFVVLDPANHTFNMFNSGNLINTYKNLKIFGWRKNSDGINAFSNSEVSNCFIRVQDDVFYLGSNVKIHDTTIWTDSNGSPLYLNNSDANSYFQDIKVIYNRKMWHGWNSGVIGMREINSNLENVLCKNVKVEDPFPTVGLFQGNIDVANDQRGSTFNNIVFENITQLAPRVDGMKMRLLGTQKSVWKNITIRDCKYKGEYLTELDENWQINEYVDKATIKFEITVAGKNTITASKEGNGEISPSGEIQIDTNSTQTYVITPNEGYEVNQLTVDGINLGAINSYTFTDIIKNHTISVTFELAEKRVKPISSWTAGIYNPKVSGSNRLMVVMVMGESTPAFFANVVTYGGQLMTKVVDKIQTGGYYTYASIFTLNEIGIAAADPNGEILVTWSRKIASGSSISSVMLINVDQSTPFNFASNNLSGTTISTPTPLATKDGDMVLMCGATENDMFQVFNNDFSKETESNSIWGDGLAGYKRASGANETPSFTQSSSGRMVICSFVAKRAGVPLSTNQFDKDNKNTTIIYPNPNEGILNLEFTDGEMNRQIKVFDTLGKLIYNLQSSSSKAQIDLSSNNLQGFVMVQVITGKTISNHKVIFK